MTIPSDLDKSGSGLTDGKLYFGPSLGWLPIYLEQAPTPTTDTIYFRNQQDIWTPVVLGANLTFNGGTLSATGGIPDAPVDGQLYSRQGSTASWVVSPGAGSGGNVSNSGTPVSGQLGQWTSATTIKGIDASTLGFQPLDADLTAIAALAGTNNIYYRSAANTWTSVTMGANMTFSGGTLNAVGGNLTVGTTPVGSGTSLRVLYDNAGILGEYTNVQLTALIQPFTTALSGAAPASGGGTLNFLRADGVWVAPPTGGAATSIAVASTTVTGGTTLRVLYDNAWTLGEYTNVQLTAIIQPFTTALSGAAPASGGGTVNFLRADGTWATPAAGGGNVSNSGTPTVGQTAVWTDATHVQGRNIFTAALTAPGSPVVGDFWYSLNTGILSVYIDDGNSLQWVQVSPAVPGPSNAILNNATTNISVGYTFAPNNIGNIPASFTANPALGNYQYGSNNAARTWIAPTSDCAIDILVTNTASAGVITFSGFTVGANTGDALDTVSGDKFIISLRRIHAISTYYIRALQ
jgi:hypothetical protein